MAFAYTARVFFEAPESKGRRIAFGTFTSDGGSTGGDIVTGLRGVESMVLTHTCASVVANAPVINETLPLASGTVTIVTDANGTGTWIAVGK